MKIIQANTLHIFPGKERKNTLYLQQFLETIQGETDLTLQFEPGEYHFYPDYAPEAELYIPNHDEDMGKRVAFYLHNVDNLVIDGGGSRFIFHTDILPFFAEYCQGIRLQNLSMDYERCAYSQGMITKVEEKAVEIRIDREKYPYFVKHGRIFFQGENDTHELTHSLEMDGKTMAPAYGVEDWYYNHPDYGMETYFTQVDEDTVRLQLTAQEQKFPSIATVGNLMILRHHPRSHPGIYLRDCSDVQIENLCMYHTEGMGVIGERCENVTLHKLLVRRNEEEGRAFTLVADATHFVHCKGQITLEECAFENQLDDNINVHGIYLRVVEQLDERTLIAGLTEVQQKGVKWGTQGEQVELLNARTMEVLGGYEIEEIVALNKDNFLLRFTMPYMHSEDPLVLENVSWCPAVKIHKCTFQHNRARGVLFTTRGKIEVSDCIFRSAGAAILVEGDASYWYESGMTKDIRIVGNTFEGCSYIRQWGDAPIQVSPSAEGCGDQYYHQRIEIADNTFSTIDDALLKAKNVKEIIFAHNRVTRINSVAGFGRERFVLDHVGEMKEV